MADTYGLSARDVEPTSDAVAIAAVQAFLRVLARNLVVVEQRATPIASAQIFDSLWTHLAAHIPHLAAAFGDPASDASVRRAAPPTAGHLDRLLRRLRLRRAVATDKGPTCDSATVKVMQALARTSDDKLRAIAAAIVERHRHSVERAFAFLTAMNAAKGPGNPIVFLTVGFPTTWAPLAAELTRTGARTCSVCLYDYTQSLETGVLNTAEIPVGRASVLDFIGHLIVLAAGGPAVFLVNGDAYYGANWDAARATLTYLLSGTMLAAAREAGAGRGTLVALKYDGIQPLFAPDSPIDRDPADMLVSHMYRFAMRQADRIVYNANSTGMGAFNDNAVPLDAPRLHFYRYALRPQRALAKVASRAGQEIHLVILSSFLPDSEDHTRNHQADVVRSILRQRIHVHYYCNTSSPALDAYRRSLPTDIAEYFHPHAIIRDQRALVEAVQQFDLGLVLSDDAAFLKSIAALADPFYREAESVLRSTTMNSGAFVFAAAGVPFVYPRYMVGMREVFGDEIAMPMAPSELGDLRRFVESCDLPRRIKHAEQTRHLMWMETNIARFAEFIDAEPPSSSRAAEPPEAR